MALLSPDKKRGIDPNTGEPFYWRGWFDGIRADDGMVLLRNSMGPQMSFPGRIVSQVVGRKAPPFKTVPRYVDLYLFSDDEGGYVAQRRWISEAHGEDPCKYTLITADTLEQLEDRLMNYSPAEDATGLYDESEPGGKRRNDRMKAWMRTVYAERVRALINAAA